MIVDQVFDKKRIYKVLKDSEIFSRIAEDGIDIEEYEAPDDAIYIMNANDTGLMIYHWQNEVTLECHVHVLKEFRYDAVEFGKASLDWAWKNTNAVKIVAQIPEIYPDVLKFALKNKFEIEGINESSYVKNGELYDQVYVGLIKHGLCT